VLLMDLETIGELGIAPGDVKENITTRGLDIRGLLEGQRIRAGRALLEVTGPCHPCDRMDEIRPGLKDALRGKRGVLCRVLEAGQLQRGDSIEALDFRQVGN
jgi:MOSC domain-containing protein YiiM